MTDAAQQTGRCLRYAERQKQTNNQTNKTQQSLFVSKIHVPSCIPPSFIRFHSVKAAGKLDGERSNGSPHQAALHMAGDAIVGVSVYEWQGLKHYTSMRGCNVIFN